VVVRGRCANAGAATETITHVTMHEKLRRFMPRAFARQVPRLIR